MHEADFDHDHEELYARSSDLEGMEILHLTSVGIDIGSSTSHVVFSRLTLRREGGFSTRFRISERTPVWASPILLTPYTSATRIDLARLRGWIEDCYAQAGLTPDDIDTGAVVITGEALTKENAPSILEYFARAGGKFVCASAGPHHEALLAAHGSGAVELSARLRKTILNVDIGGGTTKLSFIQDGHVRATAAINIGARLVAFDGQGRVTRLEKAGAYLANAAGLTLACGDPMPACAADAIAALEARLLIAVITGQPTAQAEPLWITAPLALEGQHVDHIIFSGGVSEYIHADSETGYGDLGLALGRALRAFTDKLPPGHLKKPAQGIRATVIGAGSYTIQVSGSTSFAGDEYLLPLRGLKAAQLHYDPGQPFGEAIAQAFVRFDVAGFGAGVILSVAIDSDVDYAALRKMAEGIAHVARADPQAPVIVNVELDVAQSLGRLLREELSLPNPLLVIDSITVGDLDYVDIGCALGAAQVYPVTVKSLLFPASPVV